MTKYIGPKTDAENVATQADKLSLSSSTPDALTPDQAGAAGTATTAARSDHQHEILAGAAGTILPDDAAAEGVSSSFARADHTHAITAAAPSANLTASTTNTEGTATSFARSDHSHAITTAAPGTILPDDAAAIGTSASLARADHTHAIAAASGGTITGTNAEGTSTSFARADHNHAYGALSIPNSALALGPTYETSLPGSPVDGQEIYYAANGTNSIVWHLRYRSAARSGSGAWEFLGGQPLADRRDEWALHTSDSTSNRTVNLQSNGSAQTGPSLTLPAFGKYVIDYGAHMWNDTSSGGSRIALAWSGSSAITNTDIDQYTANVAFALDSSFRKVDLVRTSGSLVLDMVYYRRTAGGTANVVTRFMYATPVYIY